MLRPAPSLSVLFRVLACVHGARSFLTNQPNQVNKKQTARPTSQTNQTNQPHHATPQQEHDPITKINKPN